MDDDSVAASAIECRELTKVYRMGDETLRVLDNVSFKIAHGEFVSIMGPSGSGKTTLLNCLGALDSPTSGTVKVGGTDITRMPESEMHAIRRTMVGQIFQQFYLIPTITALENLTVALVPGGVDSAAAKKKAMEKLDLVGLSARMNHRPAQLSGGQQQRVAIARALVNEAGILLADEPTGNLDTRTGDDILALLKKLNSEGLTIVMVTHNPELARRTGRILHLRDGKLILDERKGEDGRWPDQPRSAARLTAG